MDLPGPSGAVWAVGLVLWAASAAVLGEFVRRLVGRRFAGWRTDEPIEAVLLDFYLGGAVLYFLAALPLGLFVAPVVLGLPVAAAVGLGLLFARGRPGGTLGEEVAGSLARLVRPGSLVVLVSALALFAVELAVVGPVGTGNTFDSGLLTTYVALLLSHHSIPLSFQPYAAPAILYPQGTTVWLGWAQLVFGLPPARTSLLVTPLFFALAPLGAFVLGRRLFASDRAGVATALVLAWLAPATRTIVSGSNDFVFAFPLVLLLCGRATSWTRDSPPSLGEAVGFGLLAGYAAALNPVGPEWLFVALPIAGALAWPRFGGRARTWVARWAVAVGASLVGVAPSLYVLTLGRSSPGFVPGAAAAPAGSPTGISSAQFIGSIDPFLFRPQDVQFSAVPALRLELAVLLVVGLGLLVVVGGDSALARYLGAFRRFAAAGVAAIVGLLAVLWAASSGFPPAVAVESVTSAGELSLYLLSLYALVAALPLVLALERFAGWLGRSDDDRVTTARAVAGRSRARPAPFEPRRAAVSLAIALAIVVPGVALTPTALPPVLSTLYGDFGNVTAQELALIASAGAQLPAGARVLVAPGSAADFLPGYASDLVLVYPLVPGWWYGNASYRLLVSELSNATLDAAGRSALSALAIDAILVTGANTRLWPPFSPAPLLADPTTFPLLDENGSAYLFGCALG